MFGINEPASLWSLVALVPIFFWELTLGLWLAFKGFRTTPLTLAIDAEARDAAAAGVVR
jgi:hypothetical protein